MPNYQNLCYRYSVSLFMFGKYFTFLALALIVLLSGCGIGEQAPELQVAKFSESCAQIAYVYQVAFITITRRTNGSTTSSGTFSSYLQLMDTKTGRKLLSKPFKFREVMYILAVQGDIVWYNKAPQCKLMDDDLIVYSAFSCQRLDMKTGKVLWQKKLL